MNTNFLKLLGAVVVLGSGSCSAASVSLRSLLESGSGNLGSVRLDGDFFVVARRTDAGKSMLLGVQADNVRSGGATAVSMMARKDYLTPTEQKVFNAAVLNVAFKCFNLLSARQGAIMTWLSRQNEASLREVSADFGPMALHFKRMIDDEEQFWTMVTLSREGQPGKAPWNNFCRP